MSWLGFGKLRAKKELHKVLHGKEVQTFPVAVNHVLELLREPEVDFRKVAEGLQCDPALTVRILRTVNSSAYGSSSPIQDMGHAISFLGLASLEQIVLGIAVRNVLPKTKGPGFSFKRYWETAAYRATLAKSISSELHPSKEAECFTAALLQDLALPVLMGAIPDRYGPLLQSWQENDSLTLQAAEKDALGCSHDEVGGWLCSHWGLPEGLTEAIATHHSAQTSDLSLMPALRMVALLRETMSDANTEEFLNMGTSEYGFQADRLLEMTELAQQQAKELATVIR